MGNSSEMIKKDKVEIKSKFIHLAECGLAGAI